MRVDADGVRFKNDLNSYFAMLSRQESTKWGSRKHPTSYVLLKLAIPLRIDEVSRWRIPSFIGIVFRVRLDIAHLLHSLSG